jgi:hypothetical protein
MKSFCSSLSPALHGKLRALFRKLKGSNGIEGAF